MDRLGAECEVGEENGQGFRSFPFGVAIAATTVMSRSPRLLILSNHPLDLLHCIALSTEEADPPATSNIHCFWPTSYLNKPIKQCNHDQRLPHCPRRHSWRWSRSPARVIRRAPFRLIGTNRCQFFCPGSRTSDVYARSASTAPR